MSLKPKRVDFNETWGQLQETVQGVITLGHVPRNVWNDRFSDVYSLCVAYPEPLADQLYSETKKFLNNHVNNLLENVRSQGDNNLLKSYYVCWLEYSQGINYLHKLYLYLNQQHIKKQKLSDAEVIYGNLNSDCTEQLEIGELGLDIWKNNMISPLGRTLVNQLLDGIASDREGTVHPSHAETIQGVIHSFVEVQEYKKKDSLSLYQDTFEKDFLQWSGEFYMQEANRMLQEREVSAYIEKVLQKLREEEMRALKFLHFSSVPKVKQTYRHHMVAQHLQFLYSELRPMVQNERKKDLSNLYPLLKSVDDSIQELIKELSEHIKNKGLEVILNLKGDSIHTQFVENTLEVYNKFKQLIAEVFSNDQNFIGALDKSCSYVINHRPGPKQPCRSPELLAKYCDSLLKKTTKGLSESEVDDKLAQSITIFKYIDDKDVFQKFYGRMLAKRLIHQQSQSMDAEEAMINRLKQACGYEFTNKLHRMFTDISLANDLNNKFVNFLKDRDISLGVNFSIYVLQAGAWPLGQSSAVGDFTVPQELEKAVQNFELFYYANFSGRKLTWLHHLCQGELKLSYLKKPYIITMQTYQMAIILLFERTDSLTAKDIQDTLQLNNDYFQRHINSLIDCKLLVSSTEELTDETVLKLNMDYSNKRTKFRITAAVQKETQQEVEHTMNSVEDDRKMYLQAAIVRIMKSRKVLRHNALIQEVLSQSKTTFSPSITMIKKCIEALIDKQYIERTPNSSDEYSYVA